MVPRQQEAAGARRDKSGEGGLGRLIEVGQALLEVELNNGIGVAVDARSRRGPRRGAEARRSPRRRDRASGDCAASPGRRRRRALCRWSRTRARRREGRRSPARRGDAGRLPSTRPRQVLGEASPTVKSTSPAVRRRRCHLILIGPFGPSQTNPREDRRVGRCAGDLIFRGDRHGMNAGIRKCRQQEPVTHISESQIDEPRGRRTVPERARTGMGGSRRHGSGLQERGGSAALRVQRPPPGPGAGARDEFVQRPRHAPARVSLERRPAAPPLPASRSASCRSLKPCSMAVWSVAA